MSIAGWLDSLRRDFPVCKLAAFADLSAGMVLASSADAPVPQERLDRLCATAAELLAGDSARRIAAVCAQPLDQWPAHAMAIDGEEIGLFLRSDHEASDALCCLVETAQDMEDFLVSARQKLDAISAGQ